MKILIIDNNDSFTANLEHLLAVTTRSEPEVVPYANLADSRPAAYDLSVISPGPGWPSDYPGYAPLLDSGTPVLGICLGMQIINEHFGGDTSTLPGCVHGRTDRVVLDGRAFVVARYHSLHLSRVASSLEVIAANPDGVAMAVKHRSRPLLGYQFHPESFLTGDGGCLIDYACRVLDLGQA
ncbi:MAG: aminodeoxychorismate/anthranilate synthase component II [candidate division Zixibacteria bacterium]|nr:aminodeoxychorismate/anthranilate synthase component II [candidate division Zixibacteria bacterium]